MPRCFLSLIQRLCESLSSLTCGGVRELEEEQSDRRHGPIQNALHLSRGFLPFLPFSQKDGHNPHALVRTVDGEHTHWLIRPRRKASVRTSTSLVDRIRLGTKGTRSNGSDSLHTGSAWWAESGCAGWPIGRDNLVALIQRYGHIEAVAGYGTHALVVLSHQARVPCDPGIGQYYAIKIFRRRPGQGVSEYQRRVTSEFTIASSLKHRNIITTFELLPLGYGKLCMCMEYCSGGDLYSLIDASRGLQEDEASCFLKQLLHGILFLHERGISHRDLKPENLLLTSRGCLKISDFGNAECFRFDGESRILFSTRRCGSEPYISPEQYDGQPFDPRYGDIWAAAIIYIAMRRGRTPWKSATNKDECFRDYYLDRKVGKWYFFIRDISPEEPCRVLHSMLSINPPHRPEVTTILSSRWLQGVHCCQTADLGLFTKY